MSSDASICTLALSHLGSAKEIQNLESDQSEEAAICRVYFKRAVELSQRQFPWPNFTEYATMSLVEEDPNDEWGFSYALPSNCAHPIKILSGQRMDSEKTAVPFTRASRNGKFLIFTDDEQGRLKYSRFEYNTNLFDIDFEMALSLLLAFFISPRVTAGDANRLGKRAYDFYMVMGKQAEALALNEIQKDVEPMSEMEASRL